jgi:hypothetical protein
VIGSIAVQAAGKESRLRPKSVSLNQDSASAERHDMDYRDEDHRYLGAHAVSAMPIVLAGNPDKGIRLAAKFNPTVKTS